MANKKNSSEEKPAATEKFAIVETSGKQFWLQTDRYYDLDRIQAEVNEVITLDKVLFIKNGKKVEIGKPYIKSAQIKVEVLEHRRGSKIIVYKMRPKKKTRRKNGHRQELTRVMVKSISIGGKGNKSSEEAKKDA